MIAWCVAAAACARGSGAGGGEAAGGFQISYPDATATSRNAKVGERFYAKPNARCVYENGRDARWTTSGARVASGELPPGLVLEDGVIGGVPERPGTYKATIDFGTVTCAGTAYSGRSVDVLITVK